VPVNIGLADLSNLTLVLAVALYALAMFAYAGDLAFGTRAARRLAVIKFPVLAETEAPARPPAAVPVPAGGLPAAEPGPAGRMPGGQASGASPAAGAGQSSGGGDGLGSHDRGPLVSAAAGAAARPGIGPQGKWLRAAFALTCAGLAAHAISILARGLAEQRTPWGNMYEFISAFCCVAVLVLVAASVRYRAYYTGLFVLLPVVLALGLDVTVVYTPAGQLVPALQSYWIAIHVTAMILAIGVFIFGAVVTVLYLLADRIERRSAAGGGRRPGGILALLPGAVTFDRLAYRSVMVGFPIWMFGIFAGAMWANEAWGRPWGWDPKETWSLISLLVYAAFLHARATTGWRGRRAAYVQLAGFACLMFNIIGINLWVTGLHSYAGVS
jgi:cytochrome c-type biogenesis protein CcsB